MSKIKFNTRFDEKTYNGLKELTESERLNKMITGKLTMNKLINHAVKTLIKVENKKQQQINENETKNEDRENIQNNS